MKEGLQKDEENAKRHKGIHTKQDKSIGSSKSIVRSRTNKHSSRHSNSSIKKHTAEKKIWKNALEKSNQHLSGILRHFDLWRMTYELERVPRTDLLMIDCNADAINGTEEVEKSALHRVTLQTQ